MSTQFDKLFDQQRRVGVQTLYFIERINHGMDQRIIHYVGGLQLDKMEFVEFKGFYPVFRVA